MIERSELCVRGECGDPTLMGGLRWFSAAPRVSREATPPWRGRRHNRRTSRSEPWECDDYGQAWSEAPGDFVTTHSGGSDPVAGGRNRARFLGTPFGRAAVHWSEGLAEAGFMRTPVRTAVIRSPEGLTEAGFMRTSILRTLHEAVQRQRSSRRRDYRSRAS